MAENYCCNVAALPAVRMLSALDGREGVSRGVGAFPQDWDEREGGVEKYCSTLDAECERCISDGV
jgi:hypothetical protein